MLKRTISIALSILIIISVFIGSDASAENNLEVPLISFTTENGNGTALLKSDGYVNASVTIEDTDGSVLSDSVVMKVRGNSTAFDSIAKKSYNFKFNKKKNVLNMGSGKKWALISNVYDPTLARNYIALSIAKELGIQYTSDFKVVEVVVDGSFRGCYLLVEPVGDGKDRVDIDTEGNEGKKDFLLELEATRQEDDVTYFKSNGIRFAVSEPNPPSEEQVSYIQSVMDNVISTLKNGSKVEIESKLDLESFVKFYVLNEFLKTVDFNFSSVFYYYKDGRLYAGPPWDYDLSSGNVNESYSSWYAASYKTDGLFISNYNLYKNLCDKPWFSDLVKNELSLHYNFFATISSEGGLIDSFYSEYKNVINRNFNEAGWKVDRCYVNVMKKPLATYQENYDYYVNWCKERSQWLLDYFGAELIENPFYKQLIDNTFSPDAGDNNAAAFGLPDNKQYKGLDLLGVQLKTDNNGIRFVSVILSELIAKASDYGYVITKTDNAADELTTENGNRYSCFGTLNSVTGGYGDPKSNTNYKYVTAAVDDIDNETTVLARFYAVIEGVTYYGGFTDSAGMTHNGCSAVMKDLVLSVE